MTTTAFRLPASVVPIDYDIDIDASPRRRTFTGSVTITARVRERTDTIELHARGLRIGNVSAKSADARVRGKVEPRPEHETVALRFASPLKKGKVILTIPFEGRLNPNMHGLYLAHDGKERAIVSQCEATDARAIFPCFDEPEMKARLRWTVRTDPGLTVITNGVPERRYTQKGPPKREVHVFQPTRVIPTYLAAITIGRYESTEPRKVARIPCTVVAGVGRTGQAGFAESVTAYVLPWYESYFGQRYNYQKLDQVAVPGFDAGAMENVGAIFYRQQLLLMQPGAASWFAQKRIAEVIAHEIAHQWFGNLVTMRWWDDLWLNEAFATWIAYKAIATWKPEWRMWDDYLESKNGALAADALVNTHPIYTPVKTPAEATELFDLITYEKGCAVLRMAESFLGEEAFRAGIRDYIARHKNANAEGTDLWNALARSSGQPVDALMRSWITQEGFPLLTVRTSPRGNGVTLHLEQRRFFAAEERMAAADDDTTWEIPVLVRHGAGKKASVSHHLLRDRADTVELPAARWVYPNADSSGFYRLLFDDASLDALLTHGLGQLTPAERATLIEDQWALVRNGLTHIDRFLDVLVAFRGERDYLVVRSMVGRLSGIERLVRDAERPALGELVRWLLGPQLDELGWESGDGESPEIGVRRAAVVDALGDVGRHPEVLAEAMRLADREAEDPSAVDANLAGIVVALGALNGDRKRLSAYVDTYLARKRAGAAPQLQARYLSALPYFEDRKATDAVLAHTLDGTVPQEQLRLVLIAMLARSATQRAAWAFMKAHWGEIGPRSGAMGIARLVEGTGALPDDLRDDVARFFADNPVQEAERALKKALEAMSLRVALVAREGDRLARWLQRGPVDASATA